MKNQLLIICFISCFLLTTSSYSQSNKQSTPFEGVTELFRSDELLPIKLEYSNLDVNKKTNDSTYLKTDFSYQELNGSWESFELKLRARGNFRRANCYYKPLKVKIKKSEYKKTLFNKNKTLKFVLPCKKEKTKNDNIVKEYMAYQIYEILSPYHFKTRLLDVDYHEIKRKKTFEHKLKGIIIEDDKKVAKRHDGKVYKRFLHPLALDHLSATRNDLFQFMISNTDFSSGYQHNGKIIYINKKMIPIPYDFDMSGLVDASYATVSQIQNQTLEITDVTERLYRGFKRDEKYLYEVKNEFISKKDEVFELIDSLEPYFEYPKKFEQARTFMSEFYIILQNNHRFKNEIIDKARSI